MQFKNLSASQKLSESGKYALALLLLASSLQAISAEKPYCRWGDCEDGIGEKVYPAESGNDLSYIARFAGGKRQDYAIKLRKGSSWICERSYSSDGRRFGIEFCATESGSRLYSYLDPKGIVKGSDYIWISNAGRVTVGRWFSGTNIWPVPVDLEKIYQDHSALRRRGRGVRQFLPAWFPDRIRDDKFLTEKEMMAAIEKNKEAEQKKARKAKTTVAKENNKKKGASEVKDKYFINTNVSDGCYFGNCEDGFGGYLSKNGDLHVGLWKKGKPHGYGLVTEAKSESECEAVYKKGKVNSLQVCRYPKSNQAGAYQRGQVDRPNEGIRWNLRSGEIVEVGIWKGDKIYREGRIDLSLVRSEWIKLRNARARVGGPVMNSFISEDLRNLRAPEDTQSQWLRDRELARASQTQRIPAEAPMRLGCVSGNCENGFGEFATPQMTMAGTFKNRRVSGYTVITASEEQCESRMIKGFHAGLEHCVNIQSGNHTFAYRWKTGLKGTKVTVAQDGKLLNYQVFEDDVEVSIYFSSEAERQELASVELENFYEELIKFRRGAPQEAKALTVASLNKIPDIAFGSGVGIAKKESLRKPEAVTKPTSTSSPSQASAEKGRDYAGTYYVNRIRLDGGRSTVLRLRQDYTANYGLSKQQYSWSADEGMLTLRLGGEILFAVKMTEKGKKGTTVFSDGSVWNDVQLEKLSKSPEHKFDLYVLGTPRGSNGLRCFNIGRGEFPNGTYPWHDDNLPITATTREGCESLCPDILSAHQNGKNSTSKSRSYWSDGTCPTSTYSSSSRKSKAEKQLPKRKPESRSNLQRLAYVVAELNAGSRQINFNYRLDRVRIDPKAFELVYEFTAMKPIRDLDTSVIRIANQTAYCSSKKLKPFRDANMPARWTYVDDFGGEFETVSSPSSCS